MNAPDTSLATASTASYDSAADGYNFAYLDEQTKRMLRRALLKAVAVPGYQVPFASREMPLPFGWGTGGIQVTAAIIGKQRHAEGDRSGLRRNHQRGQHPPLLRAHHRRGDHAPHGRRDDHPDPSPHSRSAAHRQADSRLSGADARAAVSTRTARRRMQEAACARRLRSDQREALRGYRASRQHRDHLRLPGDRQPSLSRLRPRRFRSSTIRRCI